MSKYRFCGKSEQISASLKTDVVNNFQFLNIGSTVNVENCSFNSIHICQLQRLVHPDNVSDGYSVYISEVRTMHFGEQYWIGRRIAPITYLYGIPNVTISYF